MSELSVLIAGDLSELHSLVTDVLRQRWTELYGITPAPRISRDLLVRGVAYRIQEEMHGGLGKARPRQLQRLFEVLRDSGTVPVRQGLSFKMGTKLIRQWKGRVHEVVIAGDGYQWSGR